MSVTIKYKNNPITEIDESGSKTLLTKGKYCEDNIVVDYNKPKANYKQFSFTSAAPVAQRYVTVVNSDPDVAAHYADSTALVTVIKIKDTLENGITLIMNGNMSVMGKTGVYQVYNVSSGATSALSIVKALNSAEDSTTTPHIIANANGDVKVFCNRQQANFGGAEYDIRFSW